MEQKLSKFNPDLNLVQCQHDLSPVEKVQSMLAITDKSMTEIYGSKSSWSPELKKYYECFRLAALQELSSKINYYCDEKDYENDPL